MAARLSALLRDVRLDDGYLDRYPAQLSGGERQRVAIARAYAAEPDIVLLDEVTSALDVSVQASILQLIRDLSATRGTACVLVSHDLAVIASSVQRVMVMYGGVAVEDGPVSQVLRRPAHPYTQGLLAARPRLGAPRGERLPTIAGRVPDLAELPAGCPFVGRCSWQVEACDAALPRQEAPAPGHRVRCIRWREAQAAR